MWNASMLHAPEQLGLILPSLSHVEVHIVRQLKDVCRQSDPPWGSVPILCCIFVQH